MIAAKLDDTFIYEGAVKYIKEQDRETIFLALNLPDPNGFGGEEITVRFKNGKQARADIVRQQCLVPGDKAIVTFVYNRDYKSYFGYEVKKSGSVNAKEYTLVSGKVRRIATACKPIQNVVRLTGDDGRMYSVNLIRDMPFLEEGTQGYFLLYSLPMEKEVTEDKTCCYKSYFCGQADCA